MSEDVTLTAYYVGRRDAGGVSMLEVVTYCGGLLCREL